MSDKELIKKLLMCFLLLAGGILLSGIGFTIHEGPFLNTFLFIAGLVAAFSSFIWFIVIVTTKKPEISLKNKAELITTMTRIVELLRDSGFSPQADAVRKPLQYLYSDDKDNFVKHLLTVDIWGGSGAAWEVYGFPSRQVEIEFESNFIKLVELMKLCGIKNGKADSVAEFFRTDIEQRK